MHSAVQTFRAPVVRPDLPPLLQAQEKGMILTSEIALTNRLCPGRQFLVTGSDGKTSTVSMLQKILEISGEKEGFSAYLGGNIGTSLLQATEAMTPRDCAVFELSSFQLLDLFPKSHKATLLNITQNHLDVHTSFSEYIEAKTHIFRDTRCKIIQADCPYTLDFLEAGDAVCCPSLSPKEAKEKFAGYATFSFDGEWVYYSEGTATVPIFSKHDVKVKGLHQLKNAITAAALAYPDASLLDIREGISRFEGVEHRLEQVAMLGNVPCFDSAIDTTPARVEATLSAVKGKPTVICGGSDKGLDYLPLAYTLLRHAGRVVVTGQTALKILSALEKAFQETNKSIDVYHQNRFVDGVEKAACITPSGEALVLSPGCASFDEFANYKAKSAAFLATLKKLGAVPIKS